MTNIQSDQDSGVVSYGEPNESAIHSFTSVDDFDKTNPPVAATTPQPVTNQFNSVDDFDKAFPPGGVQPPGALAKAGNILKAFGTGFGETERESSLISPDTEEWLKQKGVLPDYSKDEQTFMQSFNSALLKPLAGTAGALLALPSALSEGAAQSLEATNSQLGYSLAREARLAPNLMMETFVPHEVASARANAVIGEGEAGFQGIAQPTAEQLQAREVASTQVPEVEAAPDIHAIARQIAPDTFNEYDPLAEQREVLGNQMRELAANRPDEIEEAAPHTDEIAQLQSRLGGEDLTARKVERLQARLDDLTAKNQEWIAQRTSETSPEIENVRQAYEAVDSRMRDLAPDVSAAYRAAQEKMPVESQLSVSPEGIPLTPEGVPVEPLKGSSKVEEIKPITRDQDALNAIAQDVSKQLQAAGRPAVEADTAGQLIAEHYQARAERFGGARGTAQEMYAKDGAIIKAGKVTQRARELAQYDKTAAGEQGVIPGAEKISDKELAERKMQQPLKAKVGQQAADEGLFGDAHKQGELFSGTRGKIRLATDDAKATITLMKTANASTFIHETGHHWLDELIHDAERENAPADLARDAATVRRWLGTEVGEIPTRAHEKFARGFERYMMEGTAPSPRLAGVFAKFKAWLTDIYQTVQKLRSPITDDIRRVFDRLLSSSPERTVIAQERESLAAEAINREPAAEFTPPEQAPLLAEGIRAGRRTIAKTATEEDYNDITRGTAPETEGRAAGGGESDRNVDATGTPKAQTGDLQLPAQPGDNGGTIAQKGNKASGIYQPVPRKPLSLTAWVRKQGGLKDDGGDIASALGKGIKGLIRPKTGKSIDDLARAAWEAGYFPEKGEYSDQNSTDRPTINEFKDKLVLDNTKEQYSIKDQAQIEAHESALAHNDEADKLASEFGINTAGKTHDEFWSEIREKMSVEEQAKEAEGLAAEQQTIADEQAKKDKEFLESRGEAWEPKPDNTRTLEDLENEYRSETTAREPQAGAGSDSEPGITAREPGQLETSAGQKRSGVGTGPESATDTGRVGRDATGSADEPVLDAAGNPKFDLIEKRIEKINTTDDVDNFIRQAAADNDAFSEARRGTVSHAQTFAIAESMGVDGNFYDVMQTRKVGEAYNAHQLKAAEALFKTLSVDAYNKSKLPQTPENIAAFEAANQKFLMATSHFMAAASEAGRALNILRTMSEDLKNAKDIEEFFQRNTGKTQAEIGRQMDFMSKLDNEANQASFIQASKKGSFRDMMLEYYVNCLISGPLTHMRYSVGNVVKAITTPLVEIPLAAASADIKRMVTGIEDPDRVYWGEAGAQLYAIGKGARDGLSAAATAWKTGQSPFLPSEIVRKFQPNAIPGRIGDVINIPSRSIEGIHGFSKTVRYEMNIAGQAYRTAMKEGLTGDDFDRRTAELTKSPTDPMMQAATQDALKELYMAPVDFASPMGSLVRFSNSNMLAKIIVPFMKIGTQITREAFIERTPLGIFSDDVRNNLMGEKGGAARDMQVGKMVTGTALMGATALMVAEGNATGDGPNDPKQRAEWLLTHRPNTITIGDINIPYQGLGSLGMLMRFSANMTETARAWDEEDGGKLAVSFLEGISKSVLDDNWMRGVKDMLDAVYHPDEYGQRYVQGMATNWLPFSVGFGQVAREIDPFQRQVRAHGMENGFGILDAARDKMPIESETLFPRRDAFGEPIPNGGQRNYLNDPVVSRLDDLRIFPSQLQRKIRGVELTDQQYDDYSRIAGQAVKMRLNKLVGMPSFSQLPATSQIEMINNTIKVFREQARTAVMMQNPDIMRQALAAKRKDQGARNQ